MQERIIAEEQSDRHHRISQRVSVEQPVFLDDGTLAYATGWEERGQFEVRIGRVYGEAVLVRALRPSSKETLHQDHAEVLSTKLYSELTQLYTAAPNPARAAEYDQALSAANRIHEILTGAPRGLEDLNL